MKLINFRPPRIAMAFALGATVAHWLFHWGPWRAPFPIAGTLVIAVGFAIMMGSWWQFRRGDVAIRPTAETARLLTGGLYRLSRNPMYLGMVLMLLGLAIAVGSPPFYLAAVAYAVLIDRVFCRYEEAKLARLFGSTYANYRGRVRRWL